MFGNPKEHHLYSVLEKGLYSDFTIIFAGVEFPVHRNILVSSASGGNQYFKNMLTQQWKESFSCEILPPDGTSIDAFKVLLEFLYTGLIEKTTLSHYLLELYELCSYFQVQGLKQLILEEFENMMTIENAQQFLGYYERHSEDDQFSFLLINFLSKHSYELAKRGDFPFTNLKPEMLNYIFIHQKEYKGKIALYNIGDHVQLKKGKTIAYTGEIIGVSEYLYDVAFEDGEHIELGVEKGDIQPLVKASSSTLSRHKEDYYQKGDKVLVNYQLKGEFLPAIITDIFPSIRYDIRCDDGVSVYDVREENIRCVKDVELLMQQTYLSFQEGDKIEGNYRGRGKWYPAVIRRVNDDGTIDIEYDDGERETGVIENQFRLIDKSSHRRNTRGVGTFRVGESIEANYRGRGRYFTGRIKRALVGGLYQIEYDDGAVENDVREDSIHRR